VSQKGPDRDIAYRNVKMDCQIIIIIIIMNILHNWASNDRQWVTSLFDLDFRYPFSATQNFLLRPKMPLNERLGESLVSQKVKSANDDGSMVAIA